MPGPHDASALQVNPNSIAAKDGRIREGDRIIQVSGFVQAVRAGLTMAPLPWPPTDLSLASPSSLLPRASPDG